MNPYEILGVDVSDTKEEIRKAYRRLSKKAHPDAGGSSETFQEIKEAFNILYDDERRKRYDETGKTTPSLVTPERVWDFIHTSMANVINHTNQFGYPDDIIHVDIKKKIIQSLVNARKEVRARIKTTEAKLKRANELYDRFNPSGDMGDLVRKSLALHIESIKREKEAHEDALELSEEVEKVLETYEYKVDPGMEGQFTPGPTTRSGGILVIKT